MKWSSVIIFYMFNLSVGTNVEQSVSDTQPVQEDLQESGSAFSEPRNFYPSFGRYDEHPLGHSRPIYYNRQQEGAYSQRSQPYQQRFDEPERYGGYKADFSSDVQAAPKETHGLLGSGNFGVIPGGTFYPDNEDGASSNYDEFDSYFHNGHGRPSFHFDKPSGTKQFKQQQFANFKDFADINVPNGGQYSEYVAVYVNKNENEGNSPTSSNKDFRPKNIIESLALLDLEPSTTSELPPEKKLSKSKRKLAKLLPEKKWLVKSSLTKSVHKDFTEPLLALS